MNLGGYDHSSFNESNGNAFLTQYLQAYELIKTYFAEGDKGPNFDGFFEICTQSDTKVIPIGRINVQIKTIDKDYQNHNKKQHTEYQYKYSCKTKIFNAVKKGISLDPAVLFLIDIQNRKAFWIYISEQYVFDMNLNDEDDKVIYFSDQNLLQDFNAFYSDVKKIYEDKKTLLFNADGNRFMISGDIEFDISTSIQDEWDYLNNLLDNELRFIKDHLFNDVWKFGIAYSKGDLRSAVGLYKIKRGENNTFIKDFDFKDKSHIFVSSYSNSYYSLHDIIKNYVNKLIEDYFIKSYIKFEFLPDIVLNEIAYAFLDRIARCCRNYEKVEYPCVYYKDEESVDILSRYWETLEELSFEFWQQYINNGGELRKEYPFDPFDFLEFGPLAKKAHERFCFLVSLTNLKQYSFSFNLLLHGKEPYHLYKKSITELRARGITTVSRVWKHEDFLHFKDDLVNVSNNYHSSTGFRIKDYYSNLSKLLSIISENYKYVARNVFRQNYDFLKITDKYYIWYSPDRYLFQYEAAISDSDNLHILVNPEPYINTNTNWEEISSSIPYLKQTVSGFMNHIFHNKIPLYWYISTLLYKSICTKLDFDFKESQEISFIL